MGDDIVDFRANWRSDISSSITDFSDNWFVNLKSSVEDKTSYSFVDLQRETENLVSLNFEGVRVAYEDDLKDALADNTNNEIIIIQRNITLTSDLVIPTGKTVVTESGIILTVSSEVNVSLESGASLIINGASYFVLNELATCNIADGGAISIGENSSLMMVLYDAITCEENGILNIYGLVQRGSLFEVYSLSAISTALNVAVDGSTIYFPITSFGSEENYYIYNIDKAISIVGSSSEEGNSTLYGGFVITAEGASVSGMEIYPPTSSSSKVTASSSLGSSYKAGGGITVVSSSAAVSGNTLHYSDYVINGLEIFPYYTEDVQSYTISGNTFVGYGDISDATTSPIIIREYSADVSRFGKTTASSIINLSDSALMALASSNTFEDCALRVAVVDCISGVAVKTVVMPSVDISGDFIFACKYLITGEWNATNANLIVAATGDVTIASGVHFNIDENSSLEIMDGGSITLQSSSVLETYGSVIGEVSGSGNFIDWPNYIQFSMQIETSEDVWEEDVLLGQYVGYTVADLKTLYRASKLGSGSKDISAYTLEFYSSPDDVYALADDYVFNDNTTVYVDFVGISLAINYDNNGGNGNGNNRSEWSYPRVVNLANATTNKSSDYFAGWTIMGGVFDGDYVSVMDGDFFIELLDNGYTYLNLQAQWIETNNINSYAKAYSTVDDNCEVNIYAPAGDDSTSYDLSDYSYENREISLIKIASGTGYYDSAYIFIEVDEGYEIESVILIDGYTEVEYDMTNEAIINMAAGLPLVYNAEKIITVEVTTRAVTNTVQEIAEVGISINGRLAVVTDFTDFEFDYEDVVKFTAKTADGALVENFYIKATMKESDGTTSTITFYSPDGIYFDDDYIDGTVTFEIMPVVGRSVLASGFSFDKVFDIVEE